MLSLICGHGHPSPCDKRKALVLGSICCSQVREMGFMETWKHGNEKTCQTKKCGTLLRSQVLTIRGKTPLACPISGPHKHSKINKRDKQPRGNELAQSYRARQSPAVGCRVLDLPLGNTATPFNAIGKAGFCLSILGCPCPTGADGAN